MVWQVGRLLKAELKGEKALVDRVVRRRWTLLLCLLLQAALVSGATVLKPDLKVNIRSFYPVFTN
jgi:hypothetical protein